MRNKILAIILAVLFSTMMNVVQAELLVLDPLASQMPGQIEGIGTHFELNNSTYLNITLDSSEPIKLLLESVPEMVTMHIEAESGAVSTVITIGGFLPLTTYHMYEDNYHNHIAFTTDDSGNYTYTQDISMPHLIFIQPRPSTKYINDNATGGDCTLIGNWDTATKICTLTMDLTETIQIDSDGITLDGSGHNIAGSGTGNGIYLNGRTGVTLKNLIVKSFNTGILLYNSNNNALTSNNASGNNYGIYMYYSSNNSLISNNASLNIYNGIYMWYSNKNTLTSNNASGNNYGIYMWYSNNNTLTNNNASLNNYTGIWPYYSHNNTLTGNNASLNIYNGILMYNSNNNTLTDNNANLNKFTGILMSNSNNNTLSRNLLSSNANGIYLQPYSNNNNLSDNNASNNSFGIYLYSSSNNNLNRNNANSNKNHGIYLAMNSNNNILSRNRLSSNGNGIYLQAYSNNNNLSDNNASNNYNGIHFDSSINNNLNGSNINSNTNYGILLESYSNNNNLNRNNVSDNGNGIYLQPNSNNNNLADNNVSNNSRIGINLYYSSNNIIYHNNFINNPTQASVSGGSGNLFNIDAPTGGNYWSNYDTPAEGCNNVNGDNFCDAPYVFTGGQDNLPWTTQNGWATDNSPPVTTDNSPSGWQNADFTVSLTCTDNSGVSGCKETKFRIDSGNWQTGNSIGISTEGDHLIEYYSIDNAGNQEGIKSTHAKLDKTPPTTSNVMANPNPAPVNTSITVTGTANDAQSTIASAEVIIDNGIPVPMTAQDGNFDEASENITANIGPFTTADVHDICVVATDATGNVGNLECTFLAVYDPSAGFVTGTGWINSTPGAYTPQNPSDPDLVGKATFGFVAKYKKGANIPTGSTEFQFKVADINFHSDTYEWLVVAGNRAQYKGTGTVNEEENYGFMLTAIDGTPDKFRIKIWNKANDEIIYDNQYGISDTGNDATELGGGSIIIQTK